MQIPNNLNKYIREYYSWELQKIISLINRNRIKNEKLRYKNESRKALINMEIVS